MFNDNTNNSFFNIDPAFQFRLSDIHLISHDSSIISLSLSLYSLTKVKMVDPLSVLIGVIQKYYVLHRKCGKTLKQLFLWLKLGGVTETKNMYPKSCRIMLCYKWTLYFRILWYFFLPSWCSPINSNLYHNVYTIRQKRSLRISNILGHCCMCAYRFK